MHIHLHFFDESRWTSDESIYFRGKGFSKAFSQSGSAIIRKIRNVASIDSAAELNEQLNGMFAWIKKEPHRVLLSVDQHRSVPLFYATKGDDVWISDHTEWIYRQLPEASPDEALAAEYLILGYITGDQTLSRDIRQVEAGTIVEIADGSNGGSEGPASSNFDTKSICSHRNNSSACSGQNVPDTNLEVKSKRYFRFRHRYRQTDRRQLLHDYDDIVLQTMQRVTEYAAGRPIVVPLSGGLDSRLIALTLSRLNYPEVHCYTYGKKRSKEASISKAIAENLNFHWTQIIYTKEKWRTWFQSHDRRLYYRLASGLAGIPNIQELGALKELKEGHRVPEHPVIVGGHHGGPLTSGKGEFDDYTYRDHPEVNEDTILSHILYYHYYLWNWSYHHDALFPFFRERVLNSLAPLETYPDSPSACESWNYHERQAKFIIHAGRLYDFFGYDWWMPYCDMDYLRFWLEVPLEYRQDKSLYTDYIDSISPFEVPGYSPTKKILAIRSKIRNTPLFSPAQKIYQNYVRRKRIKNEYEENPMAWYGLLNKTDFKSRFSGRENINSFQSLELLRTIFENGFLSVDDILNNLDSGDNNKV